MLKVGPGGIPYIGGREPHLRFASDSESCKRSRHIYCSGGPIRYIYVSLVTNKYHMNAIITSAVVVCDVQFHFVLGMDYFINGEAICAAMVRGILQSYTGAPPHVVQASILKRKPVDVAPKRCCSSCSKATGDLKLCSGCQGAYYCSRDCQAKDFKVHKKACKAAAALRILLNLP